MTATLPTLPETPPPEPSEADRSAAERSALSSALATLDEGPGPAFGSPADAPAPFDLAAELQRLAATREEDMKRTSGEPLFSADELALLRANPKKLKPEKKDERKKLTDRANNWKRDAEARAKRQAEEGARAAAEAEKFRGLERLTGREPFMLANDLVKIAGSFGVLEHAEKLVASEQDLERLGPPWRAFLLDHPALAMFLMGGGAPTVAVVVVTLAVYGPKAGDWLKANAQRKETPS